MHVVLDNHLHAGAHMDQRRNEDEDQCQGDEGVRKRCANLGIVGSIEPNQEPDEEQEKRHVGDCRQPLSPEMVGSLVRRAQPTNLPQRSAHIRHRQLRAA